MKLRKLTATLLAAALGLSLSAPALAADAADVRLTKVTQTVKATLDIGDEYESFYGEPTETMLGTRWTLHWEAEGKSLDVSATDEGKVLSMNLWGETVQPDREEQGLAFPALTWADAKSRAETFLAQVFTEGEAAVFDGESSGASLNATSYYFYGAITLSGLPSPLRFRLRVRVADGAVTSFSRDDVSEYVGALSAAQTSTTADKAAALLKDTLSMRLEYVWDENQDGHAVLRWLPNSTDDFYVDAATGKLVNLTELRELLNTETGGSGLNRFNTSMTAPEAAADSALSKAELEGIAKLEGVLDQKALDEKVRAWTQLGLTGFELSGASYRVEREEDGIRPMPIAVTDGVAVAEIAGEAAEAETGAEAAISKVTATLTYAKKVGDGISRRTVTLDAKTGELESVSGYNAYNDGAVKVEQKAAQAKAEAFLKALWGEQFAKTDLYTSSEATVLSGAWSFTFAQKENGYFFAPNAITVRISAEDGTVMGVSKSFDDDVVFDDAQGLISEADAVAAWAASYPVELSYIAVPVKLDLLGPEAKPLINAGYSYYNSLKPGYALGDRDTWYSGVDAKTGELVKPSYDYTSPTVTYDDIEGHWAQTALSELAEYNVGWFGGKARPDAPLTQLDYIALLASADGYTWDLSEEGAVDDLYSYAIRRGLLTAEERDEDAVLIRGEAVRLLLDSLGYKQVANLQGIFRCDFADAQAIPPEYMGYAALAQGLDIVHGGDGLDFAADHFATRAEGAMMLWRYMKR